MAIQYAPKIGSILICDYRNGFIVPEMVKRRPVIVVACTSRWLCIVIPLSTSIPEIVEDHHHKICLERSLPRPFNRTKEVWAKCDMISTVSYNRLELFKGKKDTITGNRKYFIPKISNKDLKAIRMSTLHALGLN